MVFSPPEAEDFAFNSAGACATCHGTGFVREIDDATLVPDESKSIQDGAVLVPLVLLVSDGVSDQVGLDDMAALCREHPQAPQALADALVAAARPTVDQESGRPTRDDASVVVLLRPVPGEARG
ncbi:MULTISPECIES: hypothetical protein [unclassified Streptomyces]|uniref:hypothetical protein n=1 Tax=unclassified Streptomyces TaxID=2593676 RepID=UPI00114CA6DC|nr:hypothetical protein [Streptomyces sp. MnatMP-M77]MYT77478.1 hypothetical protein [Streptomyces sp. SID8364]